jgi:uncharacterized damage-inducible protein DinB
VALELYYRLFAQLNQDARKTLLDALNRISPVDNAGNQLAPIADIYRHFATRFSLSMEYAKNAKAVSKKLKKELQAVRKQFRDVVCTQWELWEPGSRGYLTALSSKILVVVSDQVTSV